MPASAQLDHPLDPTKRFARSPRALVSAAQLRLPDRCPVVGDAGYSICRSSFRACRTSSRMCPRSAIAPRV
jgi:hypothetical protein